jgi:hypothetical protein
MAFVTMVAVVFVALARPNYWWANLLSLSFALLLLVAPLGGILRRGTQQARWMGFGLFGWAFFLSTTWLGTRGPSFDSTPAFFNMGLGYGTDAIIVKLYMFLISIISLRRPVNNMSILDDPAKLLSGADRIDDFSTTVVVLSLTGLAFALLGGQIARFLARGGPFDPPPTTPA